ncbi:MAG: sulfotransferase [Gammaproteobacteria bacterium]|nr:sulfotransferase [Gammaproteobacteria bacterium]
MVGDLISQAEQAHSAGKLQQAWQLYQQALQQQPNHPAALGNLGIIALETGNIDAAEPLLRQALSMQPFADWQAALALTLQRRGKLPDAITLMRRAIEMDPDYALFHCRLADMYSISGDYKAAVAAYRNVLGDQTYTAEALYGLATLAEAGDVVFDDDMRQHLTTALRSAPAAGRFTARLHFAAAILQHQQAEYNDAFASYTQANAIRSSQRPGPQRYDAALEQRKFDLMQSCFSAELFASQQHADHASEFPVLLVGLPRSGTSLLTAMLDNHPAIETFGELPQLRNLAKAGFRVASGLGFPQNINELDRSSLQAAGDWYLQAMTPATSDCRRGIDKMPSNYELLGLFWLLFPRARVLHLQRDPMDTLWSCYRHDLNLHFCNDFNDLAHTHKLYQDYMRLWHERLPLPILDVSYEALIADPEQQLKRIIAFLQLPWDERCLTADRNRQVIDTASRAQARKPIYQDAVRSWHKYRSHLQPLQRLIAAQSK